MATAMRALFAAAMAVSAWCAPSQTRMEAMRPAEFHVDLRTQFHDWTVRFGKVYQTAKEWEERFLTFASNVAYIQEYNAKHTSHWLGLNGMADLNLDEFKAKYLGLNAVPRQGMLRDNSTTFRTAGSPQKPTIRTP
eukprot:jgi/Pico_ML_1/51972/g2756.t2